MPTVLEPEVIEEVVVPELSPADVYELAISILDSYGWIKGDYGSKDRGFCLIGVLAQASNRSIGDIELDLSIAGPIRSIIGRRVMHTWNDEPLRTKADVVEVLNKAAELARELRCQQS